MKVFFVTKSSNDDENLYWKSQCDDDNMLLYASGTLDNTELLPDIDVILFSSIYSLDELNAHLHTIRSHEAFFLKPTFISEFKGSFNLTSCDGTVASSADIITQSNAIIQSLASLPANLSAKTAKERLLLYLYTRNALLEPEKALSANNYYTYQLIDHVFGVKQVTPETMLLNDELERQALIDQMYVCSLCESAKLKFTEYCPTCSSIDIRDESFLHCFFCGHVEVEPSFQQINDLQCPRCLNFLKKVGEDFDRPLETGICNQCDNKFIEPEVKVICQSCEKSSSLDTLSRKCIYSYTLSNSMKQAIQSGQFQLQKLTGNLTSENLLSVGDFSKVVNWYIQVYQNDISTNAFIVVSLSSKEETPFNSGLPSKLQKHISNTSLLCFDQINDALHCLIPNSSKMDIEKILSKVCGQEIESGQYNISLEEFSQSPKSNIKSFQDYMEL